MCPEHPKGPAGSWSQVCWLKWGLVGLKSCWGKLLSAALVQKSWPLEGTHFETLSPVLQRLAVVVQPGSIPKGRSLLARVRGGRSFLRAHGGHLPNPAGNLQPQMPSAHRAGAVLGRQAAMSPPKDRDTPALFGSVGARLSLVWCFSHKLGADVSREGAVSGMVPCQCPRPGWTELQAPWGRGSCPCLRQGVARCPLRVPSKPAVPGAATAQQRSPQHPVCTRLLCLPCAPSADATRPQPHACSPCASRARP